MTQPSAEFLDLQAALAGEYSLQRELGRGGMGVVYLARDVQLDRDVAIKVLPTDLARDPAARDRFVREARTAAGLSHPHIVPIHRVGEASAPATGGTSTRFVFFVMSYIAGETLGERLRRSGPLPPADATRVMREVAWALAYAHRHGIVHRDVKPDNILLEAGTGRAVVTDFGIAHGGADAGPVTEPGKISGTAHFMSPEQASNAPVDGRSDIYALGVVGYLAVSGRLPFESSNLPALLLRQATEAPSSVMRVAPGLPPALGAVIDKCLALDPAGRFPDGETMAAALVPTTETRPVLPTTLRAWLAARNPLIVPYMGWSALCSVLTAGNVYANMTGNPGSSPMDVILLLGATASPLVPIVGFHLNNARRQFRAGHTLADLRSALEIARREREESKALEHEDRKGRAYRTVQAATIASVTWLGGTAALAFPHIIDDVWMVPPILTTMLFGALSNALDVQFIPNRLREGFQTGIRDRLWKSRVGEWLARRLGAPETSRAIGGGVFRPTEAALGVAAGELYAALPQAYRDNLAELPATVAALEARAAEARAEIEVVDALAPMGSEDADTLKVRREAAAADLGRSVAALESIRLGLLRLHAGASDLAPLTTVMDAARVVEVEMRRLDEAQREVGNPEDRRLGAGEIATPA